MIFKTLEEIDKHGNITESVSWGIGDFGPYQDKKKKFDDGLFKNSLKDDKKALEAFGQAVQRNVANNMELQDAMSNARNQIDYASEEAKRYAMNAEVLDEKQGKLKISTDEYTESQKKAREEQKKSQKGFGKLSNSSKAMLGNLLATLAVEGALMLAAKGLQKLDEAYTITDGAKIEAMENTMKKYNDTISSTTENTNKIKDLSAEFTSLSKGVDENGENIGLTAEQYERYNQIVDELVDISPEIAKSYNAEGKAIVDKNSALKEAIKAQEEIKNQATIAFTSDKSGNDVIEGSQANMKKALKEARSYAKEYGKALGDTIGDSGYIGAKGKGFSKLNYKSFNIDEALGESIDLENATYAQLEKIVAKRQEINKEAKLSGKYSLDELNNINASNVALGAALDQVKAETQPIYQWLSTAMSQANEVTGESIIGAIPEALREGYDEGLREIAASGKYDNAIDMRMAGANLATDISNAYKSNTDGVRDMFLKADKAREDFNDGKIDADAANNTLKEQADALDQLANQYAETDADLSAFYKNQATSMRNFVADNKTSIKNAFGAFDDLISSARNAKSEFDTAMSGGDYYTGIDNYKEIYDTIFNGKNNLGKGSMAFWQGAEQILGTSALKEAGYEIDAVQSKLKKWKPMLEGGSKGASLFAEELLKIGNEDGEILNEYGEKIGEVADTADGITFDIPRDHISEVADKLGVSSEMLTAMIDSARQFSNVNFHNVEDVAKAAKESAKAGENAITGKDKNTYMDYSYLAKESGLKGKELSDLIGQLDKVGVKVIDAESKVSVLKNQLSGIGVLNDKKLNLDNTIEQFHAMNMSADDLDKIIRKMQKEEGVELTNSDLEEDQTTLDYILDKYQELDESDVELDPNTEANIKSIDELTKSVDALTEAMGGVPPLHIEVDEEGLEKGLSNIEGLSSDDKNMVIKAVAKFQEDGNLDNLTKTLDKIPPEVRTQVVAEIVKSGALDTFLKDLDDKDKEVLIKALTEGEGDVEELDSIIDKLPESVQSDIEALVDYALGEQEEPEEGETSLWYKWIAGQEEPKTGIGDLVYAWVQDQADPETRSTWVDYLLGGQQDPKDRTANVFYKIAGFVGGAISGAAAAVAAAFGGSAKGTPNRRKQSHFPSMAKGGKLGPHGKGGKTLVGELGAELAWLPSESRSFLVGQYGPEIVDLPSDAVVYPADETRRIIGDTIPRNRFNFGSLATGTEFGSMASASGSIKRWPSGSSSNSSNRGGSSSSSKNSSKKSSDKAKESAYERARKALDHELEMGYISEATYYTKLNALYNKHKKSLAKNVDDKRAALEDLRKAWIDAYEAAKDSLDHQLEMGTLSEEQYYNKLKALGDKYYKNRKGYTNEWKAHLEELKDARKDVYDAQLEDLDKSLESEKITVEKYFKEVSKLQGKWLSGKEMTKDREEALEDMFDQMLDAIENEYDDVQQLIDDKDLFKAWKEGETPEQLLNDFKQQVIKYYNAGMIQANDYKELMMEIEREIQEAKNDGYEEEKDQLDEIMDLVEDLVRQETEDMIDALEDQIDAYSELIDKKKEALQMAEDEMAYMDEMTDLATQISEKQAEIAVLSRDDSKAGQAKLAEAQKELAELLKEQNQTVREETLNKTEDALDEQGEKFEEALEGEIEKLEDFLDNQSAVLEEVLKQLENRDTNKLYDRLMEYNSKYGDGMIKTVTDFWEDLSGLTKKYGNDLEKIVEILQKGTDDGKTGGLIPVHHKGLAAGFTGDGADLKQHEVYRLLTDDELVLNREDQMRLAGQLGVIDAISSSYGKLARSITPKVPGVPSSIEISVNSPINIKGSATPEVVDELNKFGDKLANNTLDKLNEALRMNGVRTRAASNIRKN